MSEPQNESHACRLGTGQVLTAEEWEREIQAHHRLACERGSAAAGRRGPKFDCLRKEAANHAVTAALLAVLSVGDEARAAYLAEVAVLRCDEVATTRRASDAPAIHVLDQYGATWWALILRGSWPVTEEQSWL